MLKMMRQPVSTFSKFQTDLEEHVGAVLFTTRDREIKRGDIDRPILVLDF